MQNTALFYFTKNSSHSYLKFHVPFSTIIRLLIWRRYEITTIVLKTTNPCLPDRVEFRHQFVKFKAGYGIYIKKECFNPLHHPLVERGVCQGLTIPKVNLLICGHFRRISDRMFRQLFLSASIIMVFSVRQRSQYLAPAE